MSFWRQLTRGLRTLWSRRAADQDTADEAQHFLEEAAAAHEAEGMAGDEARRAARLEAGNVALLQEQMRSYGWENALGAVLADLRFAARGLRKNAGFSAVAVSTLALGIGATTAIFSAVHPILFESLPYPHAERVAMVWYFGADGRRAAQSFGNFRELAVRNRTFEALAAMKTWQPTMMSSSEPDRLDGQFVSAAYFRALGVPPVLGRDFEESEDQAHGPRVAILSDRLWKRRFDADRAVIGKDVVLDGEHYQVVGVMPAEFENVLAPPAEIWTPLRYDVSLPADGPEWGHHLRVVGRFRAGIGKDTGRRDLNEIARQPIPEFSRRPGSSMQQGVIVDSLQDDVTRGVKPALLAIIGAVLLLLCIASVNVTNLLLARGAQRRAEFAMRIALGAGPARLIRQLLTESVLLALIGGALGLGVAELGVEALVALSPAELPRLAVIAVNGSAFAFALALSTLTGVAVGLIPARHSFREDLCAGLQQSSQRNTGGHRLTRRTLVVAEVALALALLAGAGLLLRSLRRLFAVDPGFDTAHLLTMQVQTYGKRYDDDAVCNRFFAQALEAVRRVPGVTAAAFTSQLPLSGDADEYGVHFERDNGPNASAGAFRYGVSPGYFETMGIPLRRGRAFDAHDAANAAVRPVIINESLARRAFGDQDPVGQRLRFGGPPNRAWDVVVGVVGDVRQTSLAAPQEDAVYVAADQWLWADGTRWLVVRAHGDSSLAPAIRRAIWSVDGTQPVVRVATMDTLLEKLAAERRFTLVMVGVFGIVALALAASGIYGVLSGSVAERTREIGVRCALGATRGDILRMVFRQGMTLAGVGALIGLAAAGVTSGALVTLLFAVSRLDLLTYAAAVAVLGCVALAACWVPAVRAARVDPAVALRAE